MLTWEEEEEGGIFNCDKEQGGKVLRRKIMSSVCIVLGWESGWC